MWEREERGISLEVGGGRERLLTVISHVDDGNAGVLACRCFGEEELGKDGRGYPLERTKRYL